MRALRPAWSRLPAPPPRVSAALVDVPGRDGGSARARSEEERVGREVGKAGRLGPERKGFRRRRCWAGPGSGAVAGAAEGPASRGGAAERLARQGRLTESARLRLGRLSPEVAAALLTGGEHRAGVSSMTELRQRVAREPDAAPEDKVAAAPRALGGVHRSLRPLVSASGRPGPGGRTRSWGAHKVLGTSGDPRACPGSVAPGPLGDGYPGVLEGARRCCAHPLASQGRVRGGVPRLPEALWV